MSHCSQVKIVSTCDCGRKQATRDDPFDVKVPNLLHSLISFSLQLFELKLINFCIFQAANYDFYFSQRTQCCKDLERVDFPVFQASTVESHPARISPIPIIVDDDTSEEKTKEISSVHSSHGNNLSKPELSEGKRNIQILFFVNCLMGICEVNDILIFELYLKLVYYIIS